MPASFEMRGTAVTHDPNLRLDSSLGKLPAFDPIKLLEGFIDMFIEVMEDIPILGDLVKVLKELLDTNGNGHLELEDLLGLLTGRGILDGLAALFGGNNGLPFGDIFAGLQQMFGGLTPGGKFDAAELIGDLPMAIVNTLRGLISAVFDLGLLRITPNMIFGGNSDNLLLASDFKAAESMVVGDGWFWDGVEGRTAPGSAKATASGNRLVQLSNLVRVEEGQKIDVAGWVKWSGVAGSGDAFRVECQCYNGASSAASMPVGVISSPAASGGWQQINGQVTIPSGVDGVRVRIAVEAAVTAGSVWWDDVTAVRVGTMPQNFITNLIPDLAGLSSFIQDVIDSIMNGFGLFGSGFGLGSLLDQIEKVFTSDGSIPQANLPIVSDVIKGITGFLSGQGSSSSSNVLADMLGALNLFTGSTNTTATTADSAQGVGSNALTNTVSIQAQVSGLVDRADAGWTARPLYASMDYTADSTFEKGNMAAAMSSGPHTHFFSGTTSNPGNHTHTYQSGDSITIATGGSGGHVHTISGSTDSTGSSLTPAVVNSSTAFLGYIRCGSVQEKRLFTFLARSSGTVSTFNLDVYRMASDGGLTLAYSSANFAGAITGVLGWVQHAIPSGTASVAVQPGDIIAIQLRMTGTGSVSLGGITTPLPLNPAGWYPLRESAVRNPSTPAPSTIAAGTANASHTSTAIPYIEAGIDTGLANAPLSLADNFNGSLSQYWLMTGSNSLVIASNNLGISQTGTSGSTGVSWGKFQKQVNTDQSKVGFTTTSPNGQRQIVWFHGSGPNDHVGLEITSSYATLYTMAGGTRTQRAQVAISTAAATYEIRYAAGTKVYSVWRNGSQITSWTDSGNTAPTGLGNRYGGVALEGTRTGWFGLSFDKANPIDDWLLADI
ncbi:hypothetical protein ACLQ3K_20165 [Tsukamurella sp. DT100]|uniref:hypothetical protein n=1 Tax=Tsukamurella sp. DT100 TaxID=3393415 RepID=UPI003CF32618